MMSEIKSEEIDMKLKNEPSEANSQATTSRKSMLEQSQAEGLEEEQLFIMKAEDDDGSQTQTQEDSSKPKSRKKKTHICPICQNTFAQGSNLKRHMILHSGEKPYPCDQCDRSFTTAANLKAHRDTHKEKDIRNRYACSICNKAFLYKCSLVKHEKRRHAQFEKKDFFTGEDDISVEVPTKKVVKNECNSTIGDAKAIIQPTDASSSLPEANEPKLNLPRVVVGNMFNYWLFGQFQAFLNQMILSGNSIPQGVPQANDC